MYSFIFFRRRHHPTSHRSSSFTLLQSLAVEDSRDKPTYSVLLGQLFAFIGTTPDQAVCFFSRQFIFYSIDPSASVVEYCLCEILHLCRYQAAVSCRLRRHGGDVAARGSKHLFI